MPFVAKCSFCPTKVKLPDKALAGSVCCPKCKNYFTAVPFDGVDEPAPSVSANETAAIPKVETAESTAVSANAPSTHQAIASTPMPHADASPRMGRPEFTASDDDSEWDEPSWWTVFRRFNLWGVLAIALAAGAVICASLPEFVSFLWLLRWLAWPMMVGALVAVGYGWWSKPDGEWETVVPLGLGTMLGVVVIAFAVFWPEYLGTSFSRMWIRPLTEPSEPHLLSADTSAPKSEWLDLSKGMVKWKDIQVLVTKVRVQKVQLQTPNKKKKYTKKKYLFIVVRTRNADGIRAIRYRTWGTNHAHGKQMPQLTDNHGHNYDYANTQFTTPVHGQAAHTTLLPGEQLEDTLVFPQPASSVEHMRLELPGHAWQISGTLKLQIPGSWLETKKKSPSKKPSP